jgi:hypothetical protein
VILQKLQNSDGRRGAGFRTLWGRLKYYINWRVICPSLLRGHIFLQFAPKCHFEVQKTQKKAFPGHRAAEGIFVIFRILCKLKKTKHQHANNFIFALLQNFLFAKNILSVLFVLHRASQDASGLTVAQLLTEDGSVTLAVLELTTTLTTIPLQDSYPSLTTSATNLVRQAHHTSTGPPPIRTCRKNCAQPFSSSGSQSPSDRSIGRRHSCSLPVHESACLSVLSCHMLCCGKNMSFCSNE